jgi:hypothetical protein
MGTSSIVPMVRLGGAMGLRHGPMEGYAYLGLGGLFVLAALSARGVLGLFRPSLKARPQPARTVLLVLCLALAVYAVSPSPFVFGERWSGIPALTQLIAPIVRHLRTTGRFIWPLFYFVLIFGFKAAEEWLLRVRLPSATGVGAALLLGAQTIDVGPWLLEQGQNPAFNHPPRIHGIPRGVRKRFSPETRFMVFSPPVERVPCPGENLWKAPYYGLALFAARHHLIVNTDFRAGARETRATLAPVCAYTQRLLNAPALPPDVLLVRQADAR